jgi:predicted lipoprotein
MIRRLAQAQVPLTKTSARQSRQHSVWTFVLVCLFGAALAMSLAGCTPWTIRPISAEGGSQGQGVVPGKPGFSATAYVGSIWDSQVLPTVQAKATDLQTLLTALKADPEAAKQQYGHHEGQRPYNFLVKGEAKVLAVDTSTRSGSLKIDLAPGDGQQDAAIQLGPVIRGTSLRDALPFIQFNQFTNQLEYADVSNQLNDRVAKDVIGKLDLPSLQGKTIEFQGAFTFSQGGTVLITPVKLQVK